MSSSEHDLDVHRRPAPPPPGHHHLVVGYDGSEGAQRALAWAGEEAERLRAPVRVVVCTDWHPAAVSEPAGLLQEPPDLRALGEQLADQAVGRLVREHPGLEVSRAVHDWAAAAPALLEESGAARLLVLGSRGHGAFADLALGSTSAQVAVHARCPVVVVRPTDPTTARSRGVVVGADTSPAARCALRFALEAAASRGVEVTAVRAWQPPSLWGATQEAPPADELEALEQAQAALLTRVVSEVRQDLPEQVRQVVADVVVHERVLPGHPASVLLQAAHGAELLVVGSRGAGGFRGLLLGSVSRAVLHHAHGAVAVVHREV